MNSSLSPTVDELLGQSAWMRRLARSLCADEARADDLAQETWLRALTRSPLPAKEPRALLRSLLRGTARNQARSECRRRTRELSHARGDQAPPTDELVERAQLQQLVVELVLQLEEPARSTLLGRYFDDKSPRQLARELGLPASTIRSRLARGLERLRHELDERDGGRAHWVGLFLTHGWLEPGVPSLALPISLVGVGGGVVLWAVAGLGEAASESPALSSPPPRVTPPAESAPPTLPAVGDEEQVDSAPEHQPAREETPQRALPPIAAHPERAEESAPAPAQLEWAAQATPPGLVPIQGGRTWIGLDPEEVEPLILASNIRRLVGETPRHRVQVDDFSLMVTEVTNEQYAAYVRATGAKIPRSWGTNALAEGAVEFAGQVHRERQAARASDEPYHAQRFDPARWWAEHWHEVEWELPADRLTQPVEFVDYTMAQDYAAWAGLRLMTEFEFQRAGRQNGDASYVWGDEWEQENCYTLEIAGNLPAAVGSYAGGATEEGVYDLLGNVWEWTSSPYSAFPDYEPLEVEFERRRREACMTSWDANQRVAVGGSYKTPRLAARLTTRRATERWQATDALGFRCAASARAGVDVMSGVLNEVPREALPEGVVHAPERTVSIERWLSAPGSSAVEHYRVITRHDHFSFTPVAALEANGIEPLRLRSHEEGPQHLGLLSFTLPLQEPDLKPGTYLVAWRGSGEPRASEPSADPDAEAAPWSTAVDSLVFYNTEGAPVLAVEHPAQGLEHDRLREGAVAVSRWEPTSAQELEAGLEPRQELHFTVPIPGTSRKGFQLQLRFELEDGSLDGTWRR